MSVGFPINTIIVIVVVMFAVSGAAWLSLSHALEHVPLTAHARRAWRWGAAVVLGTWLLVRLELAVNPPDNAVQFFPYSIVFVGLGALIGVGALLVSPVFRQIIRAIPQTWLIGIHAIRLAGFVFLALADMGRLPAEFALPAGYGDMAVGLLALVSVYALVSHKPYARALAIGVNVLGMLDFMSAFATGLASIGPFVLQLEATGISPLYLNYVLIVPSFGVPVYALLHVYSLFQLFSRRVVHEQVTQWTVQPLAS